MTHNSRYPPSRGNYRPPPRDYRNNDRDSRDRNGPASRDAYRQPSSSASRNDRDPDFRWSRDGPIPPSMNYRGQQGGNNYRPPEGDFTFRVEKPAGVQESDNYRPQDNRKGRSDRRGPHSPDHDSHPAKRNRGPRDRYGNGSDAQPFRQNRPGRGGYGGRPWRPFIAAERELLKTDHNPGSEVAFFNASGGVTYRALDELSDSDEAEMDISGDEAEAAEGPSHKRVRMAVEQSASDNNTPKWSNPDPYTALPPETASQVKKKDVVQMIRKARVQAQEPRTSLPSESADFISFDLDDSDASDDGDGQDQSSVPTTAAPASPAQLDLRLPPKPASAKPVKAPVLMPDPSSSALGSRKRTHDDEIKMPHTRLKRATKTPVGGGLAKEWLPDPDLVSTPWMCLDHSGSANAAVW